MATSTFTLAKQGDGKDLGPDAIAIFGGFEVPITLPDAGATAEETLANILAACDGDHVNVRSIFVAQSAKLTKQKAIKERAKVLAVRVLLGQGKTLDDAQKKVVGDGADNAPITLEAAQQELLAIGSGPMPKHTVKGEGDPATRKATSAKKAREDGKAAGIQEAANAMRTMLAALPKAAQKAALESVRETNPDMHAILTADAGE